MACIGSGKNKFHPGGLTADLTGTEWQPLDRLGTLFIRRLKTPPVKVRRVEKFRANRGAFTETEYEEIRNREEKTLDYQELGLVNKFAVSKIHHDGKSMFFVKREDGKDKVGGVYDNRQYYVIDLRETAKKHGERVCRMLSAYSKACASEYPTLASDIDDLLREYNTTGKWKIVAFVLDLDNDKFAVAALEAGLVK